MQLTVHIEPTQVAAQLGRFADQAPFATSLALNNTLRDVQNAEQSNMKIAFSLRGTEQFFKRSVKMSSTHKTRLEGDVRVEGPQSGSISTAGRVSKAILRHEEGGPATSDKQYRAGNSVITGGFYLPAPGLRTATENPPRALYPHNIGITPRRDASGGWTFSSSEKGRKRKRGEEGRERSYFATARGIFERRHFGTMSAVRLLWTFARRITLKPRLRFLEVGQRVADDKLDFHIARAIDDAIRTAFHA